MIFGTLTLNKEITQKEIENIMKVNTFDGLFIQYLENELYNTIRAHKLYFSGDYGEKITDYYNQYLIDGKNYIQVNLPNDEDRAWDILESVINEDTDFVIGNFGSSADSNLHFELTFKFNDVYKDYCHETEKFPLFTDVIYQERNTWILSKNAYESGDFEIDKLTSGVFIKVR